MRAEGPDRHGAADTGPDRVRDARHERRALLRATSQALGAAWIDVNAVLASGPGGLRPEHTYDGVHLRASGYVAWRDAIAPRMP